MAALTMAAFAAACSTSTSERTSFAPLSGSSGIPLEIPISGSESRVRVCTTPLRAGDYYGSIQIRSDLAGSPTVSLPVHRIVYPASASVTTYLPAPTQPNPCPLHESTVNSPLRADGAKVRWVVPPPPRAEAGIEYPVSYYGWIESGKNSYTRADVQASDSESLGGYAPINFNPQRSASPTSPIEGTIRFESCSAQTVYVYLRSYTGEEIDRGHAVRVEVSPPSRPLPILSADRITATSVEGPSTGPFATLGIQSLCNLDLHWKILNTASWLDISPSEGVGNQSVSLSPTASTLAPGDYRASQIVALADGGRTAAASARFTVIPIRLQWDPAPPSSLTAGAEILAIVRGSPGFAPYETNIWFEPYGSDAGDYYTRISATAMPRPDGTFIAPLRISSCTGGRYKLRAAAYSLSSGRGEAPPSTIDVSPAEGGILDVSTSSLRFSGSESTPDRPYEFTISMKCANTLSMVTLTASQPWIQLEDASNERQEFE